MAELKLPGEDDKKKGGITPTRIVIWLFVGGVGVYLIVSGLIGILTKGQ